MLAGEGPELERVVTLRTIDDLWADYLTAVADLRADAVWISLGAANPFANYIVQVHAMFKAFEQAIDEECRRGSTKPSRPGSIRASAGRRGRTSLLMSPSATSPSASCEG